MEDFRKRPLPTAAIAAVHEGNAIQAIKLVREAHGLGLKEAHDLVREYIASRPELRERFAEAELRKRKGCLLMIGVMVGAVAAAMAFKLYRG